MPETLDDKIALLLERWSTGDQDAMEELAPLLYDELRHLAHRCMRHERSGHTLQATAVVHEAYIRLMGQAPLQIRDRAHFIGIATRVMRQVLVDYSRERGRIKRGGQWQRITLGSETDHYECRPDQLVELDQALESLASIDRQKAAIVELRYFGGLTIKETAGLLEIGERTVSREWRRARAWLYCALQDIAGESPAAAPA